MVSLNAPPLSGTLLNTVSTLSVNTVVWYIQVVKLEPQSLIVIVFDYESLLTTEIFTVRGIDDSKFALLERSVLQLHAHQQQMRKLDDMDWTDTSTAQKVRPVFLCLLVVDSVFEVVRQKILDLNRSRQPDALVRIDPVVYMVSIRLDKRLCAITYCARGFLLSNTDCNWK